MGLLDPVLTFRAGIVEDYTIDPVHGGWRFVVFRLNKTLDSAIVDEILPVVHLMEHIIHGRGDLASWLTYNARMIILSSKWNKWFSYLWRNSICLILTSSCWWWFGVSLGPLEVSQIKLSLPRDSGRHWHAHIPGRCTELRQWKSLCTQMPRHSDPSCWRMPSCKSSSTRWWLRPCWLRYQSMLPASQSPFCSHLRDLNNLANASKDRRMRLPLIREGWSH